MHVHTLTDVLSGGYPRPSDFLPARERFENLAIIPFIETGEVLGAAGYGSAVWGEANEASDQDYLVIVRDLEHLKVLADAERQVKVDFNVPFDILVFTQGVAAQGYHTVDESFREHLHLALRNGVVHGCDPIAMLAPTSSTYREALGNSLAYYLSVLARKAAKGSLSEEKRAEFFKTVMEKPTHAMRVALQYECGTISLNGDGDTKASVVRQFSRLKLAQGLMEMIEPHRRLSAQYVDFLRRRRNEQMSPSLVVAEYRDILARMESMVPIAYGFIETLAERMGARSSLRED